ncbi:hypothetical protein FJV76_13270 [Mesorhizobium sp. WSM4303]|nr:hypothetical protein FJV77_07380 [Mesorhizobium sp. WSM4306]TRD04266.1 hypothetical protein FJV76_13270 [Mesorhizobium sp. WSM4303]
MTKLSDLGPLVIGPRHGAEPADKKDWFYNCPHCGQLVDQRDARQVFYHEGPGHEPLEPEDSATILKFIGRKATDTRS